MSIKDDVYTYLSAHDSIMDIVGTDIWIGKLPTTYIWAAPAITIHRISQVHTHDLDGAGGTATARIQIDCWAKDEIDCDELAEEVRLVLHGYTGTIGNSEVLEVEWLGETDIHEPPIDASDHWRFHVACDCMIDYRTAIPDFS